MDSSSSTSMRDGPRIARGYELIEAGTVNPPTSASDAVVLEWFGGDATKAAGVRVTPDTAMRLTTVWRCVTLIAGAVMSLPLPIYARGEGDGRDKDDGHPYARLLRDEPNEEMSGPELMELLTMSVLLYGNGYALMRQARNGTLTSIDYFHANDVEPFRSGGTIWYRFTKLDGSQEVHHASYVIHFRGPGRDRGGLKGLSPIAHHAQTIGIGIASRDYTAGQFERGLLTNDYFHFPEGLSKEQRDEFKAYTERKRQGVANAHNPLILAEGGEWKRLGVTAKDAQLLELMQYSTVDVCRIYGIPPFMVGEMEKSTSWGSGIEQQGIGVVRYSLRPHFRRFQGELNRKLFPGVGNRRATHFVEFDADGLMEGDAKAQGEFFRIALGGNQLPGFMSVNEVRRKKNLPPIPGGDQVYLPTGDPPVSQPEPEEEPDTPQPPPADDPGDDEDDAE